MHPKLVPLLAIILGNLASCAPVSTDPATLVRNQPARQLKSYHFDPARPVVDRIGPIPDFLLRDLKAMDKNDQYRNHPVSAEDRTLWKATFSLLPASFQKDFQDRNAGIYFVEGLQGGGLTDFVLGPDDKPYFTLILNPEVLTRSLPSWVKFRDNSPFDGQGATVADNRLDPKYRALVQTLFHEAAHAHDLVHRVTPWVDPAFHLLEKSSASPRLPAEWTDYRQPGPTVDFTGRKDLAYYGLGKALGSYRQADLYRALAKTAFVSLYASQSWAEDYAETFTWFALEQTLGVRYTVEVKKGAQVLVSFSPLDDPKVRARWEGWKAEAGL